MFYFLSQNIMTSVLMLDYYYNLFFYMALKYHCIVQLKTSLNQYLTCGFKSINIIQYNNVIINYHIKSTFDLWLLKYTYNT